jgi:hypothetical protein
MRAESNESPFHSRCSTINIPPCPKVISAKARPKVCSPLSTMMKYPYEWHGTLVRRMNEKKILLRGYRVYLSCDCPQEYLIPIKNLLHF